MKDDSQPSEQGERSLRRAALNKELTSLSDEQRLLDSLLDRGFAHGEARQLMKLREHLYLNAEMRQRMKDDRHVQFARWLYEHGELDEW